ncbi:hypothetical protein EM20IM_09180 [Candidatus Methylacidiphilum infernorum]|uniref:Uncharacterized protein n=1 Tax=Candidatus Methylacidiphilum infernorum TaxID=511746 RepID=A0ABX7PV82_9BACT|nr:hypothetical protein [Candidatus Methylacidiphilum infernorum]QSR86638.1 hypothetical protein EM20IM_09180 [Candidatus Methylacidiphilum infernorum]
MKVYTTFPSRPYVVIGLIAATNKLFGNPKTHAVELAKKVGADALLLIDYNRIPVGTTGNWYGTHNYFSGYGSSWGSMNSRIHYRVIAQYAAIRWFLGLNLAFALEILCFSKNVEKTRR